MENKEIILKYILVDGWDSPMLEVEENITEKLQNKINDNCPEGYRYKETISFEKEKGYHWIKAIVAYERIPR